MSITQATIPITQIQALRLSCKQCQAALILPLTVREVPSRCFNCAAPFPHDNLKKLLMELSYTLQDLTQQPCRHDVAIEAVLKP